LGCRAAREHGMPGLSILRRNEAKMTNALYLFLAYPHWLIVTGTVLLILGLIGLALFSRRDVEAELNDMASDQGPSEPEAELAQTQAADRKTKLEE